jgi:hypothetical protein
VSPVARIARVTHSVAFWTGFTAFFANLAGVRILQILGTEGEWKYQLGASLLVSLVVGSAAYGRERLKDAQTDVVTRRIKGPEQREDE